MCAYGVAFTYGGDNGRNAAGDARRAPVRAYYDGGRPAR